MIHIENVSRRGFLKGVLGTSAFVLGARFLPGTLLVRLGRDGSDTMATPYCNPTCTWR